MAVTSVDSLERKLLAGDASSFVIFTADGSIAVSHGEFAQEDGLKAQAALTVLQQSAALLRPGEKMQRSTVRFEACAYVASVVSIQGASYGVVVQRAL
jgi:hypothetical protein